VNRGEERKIRSDKKKEIKPYISIEIKDAIYRLSYITQTPVKDVCEQLVIYTMNDREVIDHLTQFFQRDIRLGNTIYRGFLDNPKARKRLLEYRERVTVRFKREDVEPIVILSYALDCSPTRTTAILLENGIRNMKFINRYVEEFLRSEITESQMRELRLLLKFVKEHEGTERSLASLLSVIVDEVRAPVTRVKDAVAEFLAGMRERDDD